MNARRASLLLVSAAIAVPVLAGCGGGSSNNADVGPAAAVPANAPVYIDATVRPTGAAQSGANAALGKILNTNDPGGKLISQIEQSAAQDGKPFNYQQDVAPWLGEKAGFFFTTFGANPDGAAVIETKNTGAALNFARQQEGVTGTSGISTADGVSFQTSQTDPNTVFGIVDKFLVIGSQTGFKAAVEASKGDSLGDSSDFQDSIDNLPDNSLGVAYTIPKNLVDALPNVSSQTKSSIESTAGDAFDSPAVGFLTASADAVSLEFESSGASSDTPQSSVLESVPQDAWLAVGLANVGDAIKHGLDQAQSQLQSQGVDLEQVKSQVQQATGASFDQLTHALGDAALYVSGNNTQSLTGALVIKSNDTGLTDRLIDQLQSLLQAGQGSGRKVTPLRLSGGGTGFELTSPADFPQPIDIAEQGDKIVIGYGANSATQTLQGGGQTLSSNPSFSAAKGQLSSLGVDFFLSLPTVFQLVEQNGATQGFQQAKQYLDNLDYVTEGSGKDGDKEESKFVVGLK